MTWGGGGIERVVERARSTEQGPTAGTRVSERVEVERLRATRKVRAQAWEVSWGGGKVG